MSRSQMAVGLPLFRGNDHEPATCCNCFCWNHPWPRYRCAAWRLNFLETNIMAKKSAWSKGVDLYAKELREFLTENNLPATKENMLNGAKDWSQYSYCGSALIYDCDIAERLCNPSELKRKRGGDLQPNNRESWLDVQARALHQACRRVLRSTKEVQS